MKKLGVIAAGFISLLMVTALSAQELKSVTFDEYLKTFDYKKLWPITNLY